MNKLFRRSGIRKKNIVNLIGLILTIGGAIITVVNIPIWFWMSIIGILIMALGLFMYNQI